MLLVFTILLYSQISLHISQWDLIYLFCCGSSVRIKFEIILRLAKIPPWSLWYYYTAHTIGYILHATAFWRLWWSRQISSTFAVKTWYKNSQSTLEVSDKNPSTFFISGIRKGAQCLRGSRGPRRPRKSLPQFPLGEFEFLCNVFRRELFFFLIKLPMVIDKNKKKR